MRSKKAKKERSSRKRKAPPWGFYLLDQFSLSDVRRWPKHLEQIMQFEWECYSSLAHQRARIMDSIRSALLAASEGPFTFERWQRTVKYKYAHKPLSARGSLVDPGGRFNIGRIDPTKFPPFPALYIASDKDTALQEMLCQKSDPASDLTPHEFALTDTSSLTIVSVSGLLERVINLNHEERLKEFVGLIKDFQLPTHLIRMAREKNFKLANLVRTVGNLKKGLLTEHWRASPMQVDIPHMSQIFGQLVQESGIEGIVYPSKFTGKDCLALFPRNFADSNSYVDLDDPAPSETTQKRLDKDTWINLVGAL